MKDARTTSFLCTGVYATADEIARMRAEFDKSIGQIPCPTLVIHQCALAHGLPQIMGHYGCDFRDGEFIRDRNDVLAVGDAAEAIDVGDDDDSKNVMWDHGPDDGG